MPEAIIVNYEALQKLSTQFESLAEQVKTTLTALTTHKEGLQNGQWMGMGANAFYHEMDEAVLPTLRALEQALRLTQDTFIDIAQTFETTDEEIASTVNTGGGTPPPAANVGTTHTVQRGDTLWDIGQRYGVSVDELMAANPHITNRDRIYPGQELVIPGQDGVPAPTPPAPQPPPVVGGKTYGPAGIPGSEYYSIPGVNPQHPQIGGSARPPSVDANGYGNWGKYNVGQLVRMIDDPNAPWMNGGNQSPDRITQIIRYLNPGGPNDPNAPDSQRYQGPPEGTCNAFAKDAMYLMNAPFPYHAAANQGWQGNYSVGMQRDWLMNVANSLPSSGQPNTGWYHASPEQAQTFANSGNPSIQINPGHVAVVVPEPSGSSRGGHPPYVAEGGAHSTLSNGAYRDRSGYDYFVYVY
jgi:WXG100 family type VII secretion target